MPAVIEIIANLIAALATAALAQMGVDISAQDRAEPREIRRTVQGGQTARAPEAVLVRTSDC